MLIQILHYQFHLSEPYTEGYRLTADEAKALNGLRGDRLRSTIYKKVMKLAPEGEVMGMEALEGLKAEIAEMDKGFEFVTRQAAPREATGLEEAILAVAREKALETGQSEEALRAEPYVKAEGLRRYEVELAVRRDALKELL